MASAESFDLKQRSEWVLPLAVMVLLAVLVVPLPTPLLDLMLSVNLALTLLLLLVVLGVKQPLEISVFPSVLLFMTLARLALNVATTRLVLLQADAGKIVATFGSFVVGGNLVVGLVVFLILIVIQFVVITKGATRVSEVAARFILDAMPGKQMAIDADLNAGTINDVDARRQRVHLVREAEFYGAMDGASKFVRGDAIAGLVITAINLIGGVVIGLVNGLAITAAARTYSILTVGDGLVAQIPAVITAMSAGLLITKATSEISLGREIGFQFFTKRRPLQIGGGMLLLLALVPGLPKIPFIALGLGLFAMAQRASERPPPAKEETRPPPPTSPIEEHLHDFIETDRACVEIGARLIPLMNPRHGPSLLQRIGTLRRDLARRYGLWVPLVRVRDNAQLANEQYLILIAGQEAARGEIHVDRLLAIHPENVPITFEGEDARDPAFGLPAKWIAENDRARAEISGCTVVDAPSVMITHLREILRRYAGDLLSREDLSKLIDKVKLTDPAVVEELVPNLLSMSAVHRVLTCLLAESVPITNLTRILECLAQNASSTKNPIELAELVRGMLGRAICEPYVTEKGRIHAIVFHPRLELEFRRSLQDKKLAIDPTQMEKLIVRLATECRDASARRRETALLVDSVLRRPMKQLLLRALPDIAVIAYSEVPNDVMLEPEVIIKPEEILPLTAAAT
ncbi:MAG: flagellar biosynthesis protein FlhA [Planctomycetota bacterium]|nr:flagellar biosynthesis protein FlhA [Planctomycetota bacterium]